MKSIIFFKNILKTIGLCLVLSLFLISKCCYSQNLSDRFLHFKKNYFWDTSLYKSEQEFYFEIKNGKITQNYYPVLQYELSRIVSENPLVIKDSFSVHISSLPSYAYIKKGGKIYLQYFDQGQKKLQLNEEYSLNPVDTVRNLIEKGSIDGSLGPSAEGFSVYLGDTLILLNGKQFETYRFKEHHDFKESCIDCIYHTIEVYLDKATLIPLKYIYTNYKDRTKKMELYRIEKELFYSSSSLPDFKNKKEEDLILFENKSLIWTERQRQEFIALFPAQMKDKAESIMKELDGKISFFHFEESLEFRNLVRKAFQ